MGVRSKLGKIWRRILWRFRDPDFDGMDLSNVQMKNGIISRVGPPSRLIWDDHPKGAERYLDPILTVAHEESGALVVRIPLAHLDLLSIDSQEGQELRITRSGSRCVTIEWR